MHDDEQRREIPFHGVFPIKTSRESNINNLHENEMEQSAVRMHARTHGKYVIHGPFNTLNTTLTPLTNGLSVSPEPRPPSDHDKRKRLGR